jgi:hypothetical protein
MSFLTKIVRGGTGWRVATPLQPYGPYFVLTSNFPEESTFVNTNKALLPPNSLIAGYGWSIVNQSTLDSGPAESYPVSISIKEDQWYQISTVITPEGYQISVNDAKITTISYTEALEFSSSLFNLPSVFTVLHGSHKYFLFMNNTMVAINIYYYHSVMVTIMVVVINC